MDLNEAQIAAKNALERKHSRENRLVALKPPKKGGETGKLIAYLKTCHTALVFYDNLSEMPTIGGVMDNAFEAGIARLDELINPPPAETSND